MGSVGVRGRQKRRGSVVHLYLDKAGSAELKLASEASQPDFFNGIAPEAVVISTTAVRPTAVICASAWQLIARGSPRASWRRHQCAC